LNLLVYFLFTFFDIMETKPFLGYPIPNRKNQKGGVKISSLKSFFETKSIAVVGASTNPEKLGHVIIKNIIEGGFRGGIYPVNQKGGQVLGYPCAPNLSALNETPDLMIIVVPSQLVPDVIREGGERGVKAAIIISGGFRETGNDALEQEVLMAARPYGLRILGPNCQGMVYTPNAMCASWPLIASQGNIAAISQSGTIGAEIGIQAQKDGLGVSSIISLGNKSDVNELDLIDYFNGDPHTKAIAMYIEGVSDGQQFIELARRVAPQKPLVILKPGRTPAGRTAAASHTRSLAGQSEVFEGFCRQSGIISASNMTELYDFAKGFSMAPLPKGRNVLIVTSSGGSGILAADECQQAGLDVGRLSAELEAGIRSGLPSYCVVKNPIDLTGDATAQIFEEVLLKASEADSINTMLVIFGDPLLRVGEAMIRLRKRIRQPLVVCFLGGGEVQEKETLEMHRAGIPVFPSPERAVKVIGKLTSYAQWKIRGGRW
jgi:acyl-CoA synthetase (NDP forming)